ncbi:FAD-dependent monooxygenase [Candidatus Gracilibacteria bacterium 28_42_T64]|nr:FAD-dependent monooxygenase [Candidatus Gracilibacteria bacterium 28_42_T64]
MNKKNTTVVIVGAGPTGLTAGVELARRGIQTKIIDQLDGGSKLSRAIGINPRSLDILKPSGVTEKLLEKGIKYDSLTLYNGDKSWVKLPFTIANMKYGFNIMLGLPQNDTEAILRETFIRLGGVIHFDTELSEISQTEDGVIAKATNGEEFHSDYLIGADGVSSKVRSCVGIELDSVKLPGVWSIADVEVEGWSHITSTTICLLKKGKIAGILPLGATRFRVVSNTKETLSALPLKFKLLKIHREGQFKISLSQAKEYSKGRVFLAGDSAHTHSPVGGRGMNLGIANADDLARRIAGEAPLSEYSQKRYEEDTHIIKGTEDMRKLLTSSSPTQRLLMLSALKIISVVPFFKRKWANKFLYAE